MKLPLVIGLVLLALTLAACGGGGDEADRRFSGPADLAGTTIGVASQSDVTALELRFVLRQGYGLSAEDVTLREAPASSLMDLLAEGEIDAAVAANSSAFQFEGDERFDELADLAVEMAGLTGEPVAKSVLVTYEATTNQKGEALVELRRMLAESATYLSANRSQVFGSLVEEVGADGEYLDWWWGRHELPLGDLSVDAQGRLLVVWQAAALLGDVEDTPEPEDVFFTGDDAPSDNGVATGDRTTVSLAVLDDASRRSALFALERGIITSGAIDVDLTYVPATELREAAPARLYDVIEASPLVVPLGSELDLDFLVLSAGVVDRSGARLFVLAE